jgi:hypothetical protein
VGPAMMPALQKLSSASKRENHLIPKFQNFPNNSTSQIKSKILPVDVNINNIQLRNNSHFGQIRSFETINIPITNKLASSS